MDEVGTHSCTDESTHEDSKRTHQKERAKTQAKVKKILTMARKNTLISALTHMLTQATSADVN